MKRYLLFVFLFLLCFSRNEISAQLSANVTANSSSCGLSNGSATAIPSGGHNYTYKWSNGATTATATGLKAGAYTVTVYATTGGLTLVDTVYFENFNGANTWTLNIPTGTNGSSKNIWSVNDTCGGAAVGSCSAHRNGDKTLHIRATDWDGGIYTYTGALYNAGGAFGGDITSNTAAQSADITTTGANHLVLGFDFIGNGEGNRDVGSCLYSVDGGAHFTMLDSSLKSLAGCGTGGKWSHRNYSLPASCNNLTDFRLRFNWKNDANGWGSDPSVAINNVLIGDSISQTPTSTDSVVKTVTIANVNPHAYFTVAPAFHWFGLGVYAGHNLSTGVGLTYLWDFGDGTYTNQPYPYYAYWTPGYYDVCLTVTSSAGCADTYCDSSFYYFKTDGGPMSAINILDDNQTQDPTGIQDMSSDMKPLVYPNPATDELNFNTGDLKTEQILIYNINGQLVSEIHKPQTNGVDISRLTNGVYIAEIKTSAATARVRWIKM